MPHSRMKSIKRVAVATSKGGVGKTTMVTNLSAGLVQKGNNVLLVDCDAQGNLQNQFNLRTDKTLGDLLLTGEVDVVSVRPGLDLINSGKQTLADVELSLSGKSFRETILKDRLKEINGYDFIFCDLSPTLTLVNNMALFYCDYLLIPVSMSFFAITGAYQILESADDISKHSKINLLGMVLNFYDQRTNITKLVDAAVREKWNDKVFSTVIRKNVAIEEAPSQRKTIFEHAPYSHGAEDFNRLTDEFLQRMSRE